MSRKPDAAQARTYRFTWLRSFHPPVVVRIDRDSKGRLWLTAKQLSGAGGYTPGHVGKEVRRALTDAEQKRVENAVSETHVLNAPPKDCDMGMDGAQWIFEANDGGAYHFVERWSPKRGPVREVGLVFLHLTGWPIEPIY